MAILVLLILLSPIINWSQQSTNVAPPPELTLAAIDAQLNEIERKKVQLGPSPLVSCADGDLDPTRAFIQSMTPSSPCGLRCFILEPCPGGANTSEFCLFFVAGQGTLRYATTPSYTLNIACTDDVEKPTVKPFTVKVVPNTPPLFAPPSPLLVAVPISGTSKKPDAALYSVSSTDIDGDAVFYTMSTDPNTPYMSIGYANGIITSTNDRRFICTDKVRASVMATDGHNPAIGPLNIDFTLKPANTAPYVSNLDAKVTVKENVGDGASVYEITVVDSVASDRGTMSMRAASDAGMEQYEFVPKNKGGTVKTRINPNYERTDTRSVKLYFDLDDGFCKGNKTYTLVVDIEDVNEQPTLYPKNIEDIEVYEGDLNFETGLQVIDEDINDVHTYTKTKGSNLYSVEPDSGNIYSLSEIDIDPNVVSKKFTQTIKVTDKGGLTTSATVTFTVFDANDNRPYFLKNPYTFAATECTPLGSILGTVKGDDDDSEYNNNDAIYFGGGAGKLIVTSTGNVVLTQPCINGETSTGSATIADEGIYPGPLTGIPVTISMTCGPCPPPPPPATPRPTTTPRTTTTTINTTTTNATIAKPKQPSDDSLDVFLSWLIPAIIGGLVWLALTAYLLYRYCRNPCAGLCKPRPRKIKVQPAEPRKKPKPEKPKKVAPPPRPPPPPPPQPPKVLPPPPPPPPPEPEPPPYLHGFWKTQFTDQDTIERSDQKDKPKAIEDMPPASEIPRGNAPAPPNLRLGNPGQGQHIEVQPKVPNNPAAKTKVATNHPTNTANWRFWKKV